MARIEAEVAASLGEGETRPDERLQNKVLEDCWLSGVEGVAGRSLLSPLHDLGDFLSTQVIYSPFYIRLRDAFVQQYGPGGVCDDAVGFLLRASERLVDIPEFGARLVESAVVPAPVGAEVPVTAHVQIAAGAGGPPRMIANRVFEGAGWLAARYTAAEGVEPARLRAGLATWLERLSPGSEPVDVVLGGHCSDLQAHAILTRRVLRWPGEQLILDPARIIEAASLRLRHDPGTNLIAVEDAAGMPLTLFYLGATFPSPIWGVRYALSILTQPYLLARPQHAPPAVRDLDGVTAEPMQAHGQLVLRRRTWWVSTRYLERAWLTGSAAERLCAVRRDAERHGVPNAVFAQRYVAPERSSLVPQDILDANRKPQWIDLGSPFWLAMLERIAKGAEWVSLTEPLPGPGDLWLRLAGERHVSELHIEMVVRAKAFGGSPQPASHEVVHAS